MVSLTFTQFHLEEDAGCGYDWLAVYDGPSARAAQLGRYCGTQLPGDNGTLVATRNVVTMEFRLGTQSKMFERDENYICDPEKYLVLQYTFTMFAPRSDSSVAHQGFRLTWNSTARVCGGTVTGETRGVVTSPGWPGRYPHQADCSWVIRYLQHIYTVYLYYL